MASQAAPWQPQEFSLKRAATARKLLETSDHRGSHDAQNFAEGIEHFAVCHTIFEAGQPAPPPTGGPIPAPRAGGGMELTPRQKQQALVAFLRAVQAKTAQPIKRMNFEERTFNGIIQAAHELIAQSHLPGGMVVVSPLLLLGQLSDVAVFCSEAGEQQLEGGLMQALRMHRQWDGVWAAPAAALESYLQDEGFEPLLSAADLHDLPLLLAGSAALLLAQSARAMGQEERSWAFAAQGADAYAALVSLHPDRPILRLCHSVGLHMGPPSQRAAAMAALRDAFSLADASTDHWTAGSAAQNLVICLISGLEAPEWLVAEVMQVLQRGEHHQRLASAWLPPGLGISKQLAETRQNLEKLVAKSPGAATLPAVAGQMQMGAASGHKAQIDRQKCSSCGKWAENLKRCAACRATAYCSHSCQKAHWPEHKQRCRELAAQRQQRDSGSSQQE